MSANPIPCMYIHIYIYIYIYIHTSPMHIQIHPEFEFSDSTPLSEIVHLFKLVIFSSSCHTLWHDMVAVCVCVYTGYRTAHYDAWYTYIHLRSVDVYMKHVRTYVQPVALAQWEGEKRGLLGKVVGYSVTDIKGKHTHSTNHKTFRYTR